MEGSFSQIQSHIYIHPTYGNGGNIGNAGGSGNHGNGSIYHCYYNCHN